MADYVLLGLKILLIFFVVYSLIKFYVFFFVKYDKRRKLLDSSYSGKARATKFQDIFLLVVVLILLGLLFVTGVEYISFITGLFVGMVLIQLYFHSFSVPLKPEESPEPPLSPIKIMSYAIEASPKRPWKELLIITVLLVWGLYMLLMGVFSL
jgi:hypothetical protein